MLNLIIWELYRELLPSTLGIPLDTRRKQERRILRRGRRAGARGHPRYRRRRGRRLQGRRDLRQLRREFVFSEGALFFLPGFLFVPPLDNCRGLC